MDTPLADTSIKSLFVVCLFCLQGFFLTVSPESIVSVGKHAADKSKVRKVTMD